MRLDSDPRNKRPKITATTPCPNGVENCVAWDPEYIWIEPGWIEKALVVSGLPAFALGLGLAKGFGRLGVSEVLTFVTATSIFLFAWYYFVGWFFDRRILKHKDQLNKGVPRVS